MLTLNMRQVKSLLAPADEHRIRSNAWRFDYRRGDLLEGAIRIARLLLFQDEDSPTKKERPILPNRTNTPFERWIQRRIPHGPYRAHILSNWVTVPPVCFAHYPVFLYNRHYGQTAANLKAALHYEKRPPPFVFLLYANTFRQALGLSHDEIAALPLHGSGFDRTAEVFNRLFAADSMIQWFGRKKNSIRFYGGATNTELGRYDKLFGDPLTGFEYFNRDADVRYDVGGGFATSEVERLTGRPFISADPVAPDLTKYDRELCILRRMPDESQRFAPSAMREAYLERQRHVPHLPFNVLEDSFPVHGDSCAVVSTGFMTSTVRPPEDIPLPEGLPSGITHLLLSLHAVFRVIELLPKCKSVDLFTIQRATGRVYKYKTALLQWRNGQLSRMLTTDDPNRHRWSKQSLDNIYRRINPDYRPFCRLLPR